MNRSSRHHHAATPITLLRHVEYKQCAGFKPSGLWYSVDGDWERWCKDEQFALHRLNALHSLEVDTSRVLILSTIEDIDRFTETYQCNPCPNLKLMPGHSIDWIGVASRYSGIEIAPYQWERRLHLGTFWYYTWDCASGCIWDLNAIKRFEVARGIEL